MTRQQRRALDFIRRYSRENGEAPSIREIAAALKLNSSGGAHKIVVALAAAKLIVYRPKEKRSIEIVPDSPLLTVELPTYLFALVQDVARKAKVRPEDVVVEAVRDGFRALRKGFRSFHVHQKVSRDAEPGRLEPDTQDSGAPAASSLTRESLST